MQRLYHDETISDEFRGAVLALGNFDGFHLGHQAVVNRAIALGFHMRRPVIVSRTASVEAYFDESCFQLFDSEDDRDLARAIRELHAEPGLRERLVSRAAEVNEPYRWPRQRELYRHVVERLRGAV